MSAAADVLLALLPASSTKVRTLRVTATGEGEQDSEMVVCGCLERRGSTFKIGQCGIIATDGASVWGAVLDERAHKADNQACRALSRRSWVSKLMSTLEAAESATTTSGGGAAAGAVEVVLRGGARAPGSVARLRIAAVGLEPSEAALVAAPSASPASLASSQGGAADARPSVGRVYLSTFVELQRLGDKQASGLLRALCGPRLAMANRTARSVRERQTQLEADAADAARLAAEVGERCAAERERLVAAAVALVNAKKDRLAELDERARVAERQTAELTATARGLEGELAKLRRRLERSEAAATHVSGDGGGRDVTRNAAARAAARKTAAAAAAAADGADDDSDTAAAASAARGGDAPGGGGGATRRRAPKRQRERRPIASRGADDDDSQSETEEDDAAAGWDSGASEEQEARSSSSSELDDELEEDCGGAAAATKTSAAAARRRLLPARGPSKRARLLQRRASSEDDLERRASAGGGMVVGALAALRQRAGGLQTRQSSAASLAASRQGSAVSRASSDDSLQ